MRFVLHFRVSLFIAIHLSHVVFVASRWEELAPFVLYVMATLRRRSIVRVVDHLVGTIVHTPVRAIGILIALHLRLRIA